MDKKLHSLIKFIFKLLHIKVSEAALSSIVQFIKFCIVGVSNTVISYVLNILVLFLMSPYHISWDYLAGNVIAFVLSVLWSFYWNNRFVFTSQENEERSLVKTLLKTYVAYGFTGIILNNILSWVWISILGISKYVAPLINLIISVPVNFVINKLWAFKSDK